MRIALLLSTLRFEDFYGTSLGLSRSEYLDWYRNDWSWDWCQMLVQEGHGACIYIPTSNAGECVDTPDGVTIRFLPLGGVVKPWLRYPLLRRGPVGRYVEQAVNASAFLRPLRLGLVADGIDVLCVQEYWTARFDVIVRSLDHPVLAVDQGLPDRREIKMLKRGSFRRCAGAIVQTENEAAKVARYGGAAERIPNAVDTGFFCPRQFQEGSHRPTVLFVGRLHEGQKRVSDVLHALAMLPAQWRLEIAGSGPDRGRLEALAAELGISDRVEFLGFVADPATLRDLYRRASVLTLPSAYEGLPMVLLEAMSCATPVVGSDISAIAEVIDNDRTGLLVPVAAPDRLASALQRAAERAALLGPAARAEVLACYDQATVRPDLVHILSAARAARSPARVGAE